LDVGCGFGDTTLDIAKRLGEAGEAIGVDDAVALAMELGPAAEVLRLAGEFAEAAHPKVIAAVRALLATFARADGVCAGSSTWIVSARAAGRAVVPCA
jgi:hypothetical protein